MGVTRRQLLFTLAGAALAGGGYARLGESQWLELRTTHLRLPGIGRRRPLRILLLSDFHWSRAVPLGLIARAVRIGLAAQPDLVCLAGDYVTAGERRDLSRLTAVLAPLSASAPAVAVLGNHDGGAWSRQHGGPTDSSATRTLLTRAGCAVLDNRARRFEVAGGQVTIGGAADLWGGGFDAAALLTSFQAQRSPLSLLLSHNSDVKESLADAPWDLMLCGHTHGGQVRLPLLGTPLVPLRDRHYVAGLQPWRDRRIYTTRGVGSLFGVRFNCRPEVSLLILS